MHRLQDQDLEHEYMIEGRPAALRTVATGDSRFERRPEHLEINQRLHLIQIVAFGRQFRQSFVYVKNPGVLFAIASLRSRLDQANQANADLVSGFWRRPAAWPALRRRPSAIRPI